MKNFVILVIISVLFFSACDKNHKYDKAENMTSYGNKKEEEAIGGSDWNFTLQSNFIKEGDWIPLYEKLTDEEVLTANEGDVQYAVRAEIEQDLESDEFFQRMRFTFENGDFKQELIVPTAVWSSNFGCADLNGDGYEEIFFVNDIGSGGGWFDFIQFEKNGNERGHFTEFDLFDPLISENVDENASSDLIFSPSKHLLQGSFRCGGYQSVVTLYRIKNDMKLEKLYTMATFGDSGNLEFILTANTGTGEFKTSRKVVPESYTARQAEESIKEMIQQMEVWYK